MTRFRHTAVSKFGTFRSDSNLKCHFVVVYCGWRNLPEATARRLKAGEGICYGWARDKKNADQLADQAFNEGCINIELVTCSVKEIRS